MRPVTHLHRVRFTLTGAGGYSTFDDGASYATHPHDTPDYRAVTARLGYGPNRMRFAREHAIAHHVIGHRLFGDVSPVLWALAHRQQPDPGEAALEEMAVAALQRYARAGERPLNDSVDWTALRDEFLQAVG